MVLNGSVHKKLETGFDLLHIGLIEKGRIYINFAAEEWVSDPLIFEA